VDFNEKVDQYFGTPFWTPGGKQLVVQWMNRGQDTLKLYQIDPPTGRKKEIYVEHQQSWVDWFESIYFLKETGDFIIRSDKSGWSHLYHYFADGKLAGQITQGKRKHPRGQISTRQSSAEESPCDSHLASSLTP
jgi:dipeptidyl-peptidase-4